MEAPFVYENIVENQYFTGRQKELSLLKSDFNLLINTVVFAPQGWGKSSFLMQAAQAAVHRDSSLRFCRIDLSNVRNEEVFLLRLAQNVLDAVSSSVGELVDNVRTYLPKHISKLGVDMSSDGGFTLDVDWEEVRRSPDTFIDLPERIAADKGIKMIVCIDDFHNAEHFSAPEILFERLKECWRRHTHTAYCISSIRNEFVEKFISRCESFSVYGKVIHLDKIERKDLVSMIKDVFADSAKHIDNEVAGYMTDLTDSHPGYIQQLAQLSWLRTRVVCPKETVDEAFVAMVDQMGLLFRTLTSTLTTQQLCFLHALLAGESVISSAEVLHRHRISSATSASRSKTALLQRGIICRRADNSLAFTDPIYAYWLRHKYYNQHF